MTDINPIDPGQISGTVLLYSNPEPLSVEQHGGLKMKRSDTPYAFAAMTHIAPIQVSEFGPGSLSYPIIFAGDDKLPLAVMSIRPNENLYISREGKFAEDAYIPAYIRRYPFVLANNQAEEQLIVCIDRDAAALSPMGDVPLFNDGKPSEYTEACIKFCSDFETERHRTQTFVDLLKKHDLFEPRQTFFQPPGLDGAPPGEPIQIADYFAVSDEKMKAMPSEPLTELRDSGALQQIYAHLNSLFGWDRLIAKTMSRAPIVANA